LLTGQKRLPMPPAIITTYLDFIIINDALIGNSKNELNNRSSINRLFLFEVPNMKLTKN